MQRNSQQHTLEVLLVFAMGLGALISMAACAPSGAATGTPPQQTATASATRGTVMGVVVAGPACPVERVNQPCPPKPVPNREVLVETPGGVVVAQVVTDQNGKFAVTLSPGTYLLKVPTQANAFPIQRKPQTVTVAAGQTVQVQVMLDSGIRYT